MSAAVEVDVAHRLGEFELAVAFTVQSGIAVRFGPSGSGKSMTLALIAGLLRPDSGTIAIGGRVVVDRSRGIDVSTQQRRIGMVFQDGLLLPHRTVLDNVALAVRQLSKRRERRAVARDWLERVGAAELADRRPGSLSGGQRQRVALARGLAGEPALLLLDEPLSALDLGVRRELRALIRDVIAATGVPSLLVTHDAEEAQELGDVVIEYAYGTIAGTHSVEHPPPRPPEAEVEVEAETESETEAAPTPPAHEADA
ncbi:MAG TPA: ATP-binding cassette domain-containing protein [Solirubrobacteraceae bacterium]|nr:ATP-binding cassette domain-containing protein [Solirubrobacteraceae bacterium]